MARTRSSRQRRTAWYANASTRNAITADGFETNLIWDGQPLTDVGQEPTLLRIRGWIGGDPNFDPSGTGASYGEFRWAISAGVPMTALLEEDLEDENVLWTGMTMWAGNRYRQQLTAVGVETWGHMEFQHVLPIDVKAKRVLRAPTDELYLNAYAPGTVAGVYSYMIRMLFQVA